MLKRKFDLQLFANLDDIISTNAQAFEGSNIKDQYAAISTKLGELGYDVLINNKKSAEFIPSSRLGEVVAQRDNFKTQVGDLNAKLLELQKKNSGDTELNGKLQDMINQNTKLLADLETARINTEIMAAARDAHDPKAVVPFIDMNNIKVDAKGNVIGADAEVARIKAAMPFLFQTAGDPKKNPKKLGMDNGGGNNDKPVNMNAMIRGAAGRGRSF